MSRILALLLAAFALVMCVALSSCSDDEESSRSSDAEPVIMTTSAGVEFVRTPDSCFEWLPGLAVRTQVRGDRRTAPGVRR